MKILGLVSGGKDSCYNLLKCIADGHEIVALANLRPPAISTSHQNPTAQDNRNGTGNEERRGEMDSYMYQTVGHEALDYYAEAMGLPLYRGDITGTAVNQDPSYEPQDTGDEVEDLFRLCAQVKEKHPDIGGLSSGAIKSNYQRVRVENVCDRLGWQSIAYLWDADQDTLLQDMIRDGMHSILIKVAAMGLNETHLGKTIGEMYPLLKELNIKYGSNICGEGGEYETLTLDCPLFMKRLVLDESVSVCHSADPFAPVHYLKPVKLHLEDKS